MEQVVDEIDGVFPASGGLNETLMGEPQSIVVKVEITSPPPSPLSDDAYELLPNARPTPSDFCSLNPDEHVYNPQSTEYILSDMVTESDLRPSSPEGNCQNTASVISSPITSAENNHTPASVSLNVEREISVQEKKNGHTPATPRHRRFISNKCFAKMEYLLSCGFHKNSGDVNTSTDGKNPNWHSLGKKVSLPPPKDSLKPCKCMKCRKSFPLERQLWNHICNPGSLDCDTCGEKFTDIEALEEHQATVPCGTCNDCGKEFYESSALKAHKLLSHAEGASYKCSLCKVSFDKVFSLTNHIRKVHSKKSFECDTCGKVLPDEKSLDAHQTENTCAKCAECGKVFLDLSTFRAHRLTGHTSGVDCVCEVCKMTFRTIKGLNSHIRKAHASKMFDCPTCGNKFPDPESLQAHESEHACVKCYDCGKEYLNVSALKAHRLLTHIEGAEHKCPMCPTNFEKPHGLICHIRKVHNEQNPYICTFCGKKFSSRPQLKSHMRTHKTRPFPCDECSLRFTSKSGLLTHQRRVHVQDKPFECEHCNKCFAVQSFLQNHIKYVHNPDRALKWQARLNSIISSNTPAEPENDLVS